MEITFANPQYLWFFLTIPLLIFGHFFMLKYNRNKALKFANYEAIEKVTGGKVLQKNIPLLIFRIIIFICVILAVSCMIIWYSGMASDFDFVLAIDSSASMLADDYKPNRLEAAKNASLLFLDSLSSKAKVAVVSFAGTPILKQKLTDDINKVKEVIKDLTIEPVGGTAIGEALITSYNLLLTSERARTIILLTDGQSTTGISPYKFLEEIDKEGLIIYTIGMGTTEGGAFTGLGTISKLDEETLKNIAKETGGKYYKAGNTEELSKSFKELATSSKRKLSLNLSSTFILIALILLFIEWSLANTKYKILP